MPVNTAALKTFAPAMRRQLLEAVGRKLDLLLNSQTPDTLSTYARQIAELRGQEAENREQLLERVAYTWFNRLCALRYLDARGWHPFGCRVLMPAAEGETQPELLKLMRAGNLPGGLKGHTDESRLHGLLDGQIQTAIVNADPQGEVYRELMLATCRFYHALLPNLFEALDDATELLLPDDLLTEGSIAGAFRSEISDDDCQDVEIIGWLYQFYIAEKKDAVMARKKAVPAEDIPAVTQLFTPHWIVRYLVENSLGRLWLLNRPGSKLREHMPYYIEGDAETDFLVINKPEEIKLLDPACGSGHMLTYAFDLLALIYEEEGYAPSEIPGLILNHNLHGLEICPRAAQLAELALVFKAREKSRRFFQPEQLVRSLIIELQDVRFEESELNNYIEALDLGEVFDPNLFKLLRQFQEAKSFGSLIQPCLDERTIVANLRIIEAKDLGGQLFMHVTHLKVLRVLEQAEALAQRYHVVVANPPYMGSGAMNAALKRLAVASYSDAKNDLYSMFIQRCVGLPVSGGYVAMIAMHSWMFLSRFERLRSAILLKNTVVTLAHLGARAFDSIGGEVVATAAFALKTSPSSDFRGTYFRLVEGPDSSSKEKALLTRSSLFRASTKELRQIPGTPLSYWLSKKFRSHFVNSDTLATKVETAVGLFTCNNERFLRNWFEVCAAKIGFGQQNRLEARTSGKRYFPIQKGGGYRKWYGLNYLVVQFDDDGQEIRDYRKEAGQSWSLPGEDFYFRAGVTWSGLTTDANSFRWCDKGCIFESNKGQMLFSGTPLRFLGYLNSVVCSEYIACINPTLSVQSNEIKRLPFVESPQVDRVEAVVEELVALGRIEWDAFETSWDFRNPSLLQPALKGASLEVSWRNWEAESIAAIRRMQELETENNRLFISAYGLEEELQPDVPEEQITLSRADVRKDVAAFLSYCTGCMMGRYSIDQPGLILADSRESQAAQLAAYEQTVGRPLSKVKFKLDPDGIIPVLDGEWFEDDIVARTREFLAVTFPESSVAENLRFIEDSLGKDIRKYFCSEFYKDHLQTYKKRPIYWMVQSPKKGFACLVYLHRYTKDTLNQVLNNYFRPYLQKLEARLAQLGLDQLNDDLPARERTAARKEAEKITKVLKECQAWEQDALLPLAQQRIELDLDDGVKVNYLKLQDVLAPIPGLAAKED